MPEIITIYIDRPIRGTGNHPFYYISYYTGQEKSGPRGYGQTAVEAEQALEKENA